MNETIRKNPLTVISKSTHGSYNGRSIQSSSAWTSNPYGSEYAIVPDDMVEAIFETRGFCDIELNADGTEVVAFIAREIPTIEPPKPEPTAEDDTDAMLIDHEYRLTLLELGVNE